MECVNGRIRTLRSLDEVTARMIIQRLHASHNQTATPVPRMNEQMDMDESIRSESNLNEASSDTSQPPLPDSTTNEDNSDTILPQSPTANLNEASSDTSQPPLPDSTTNEDNSDTILPQSPAVNMDEDLSETSHSQSTCKSKKMKTSIGRMIATTTGKVQYTDEYNLHKSLDEFIAERCILKPKMCTPKKKDSDFAPSTEGRNFASPSTASSTFAPQSTEGAFRSRKAVKHFTPCTVSLRKDLNPFTSSLDDLIEKSLPKCDNKIAKKAPVFNRTKRTFDDLISQQEDDQSFENIVNKMDSRGQPRQWPKGLTPYRAVGFLCEHGMVIEMKIGRLIECPSENDRLHLWQCEVTCSNITGRADSKRKEVAREIACREFLVKLKQALPHIDVPQYEIPEEVFIDPNVTNWVLALGMKHGFEVNVEAVVRKVDPDRRQKDDPEYLYATTYFIGDEEIRGISPNANHATVAAAKSVWETVSKRSLPSTKYFVGQRCKSNNEYKFLESEAYTVLNLIEGKYDDTDGEDEFLEESLYLESNEGIDDFLNQNRLAKEHKRKKTEEHERWRNMKADLNPSTVPHNSNPGVSFQQGVSNESENKRHDETAEGTDVKPFKEGFGRGRGRAKPWNTNPFQSPL
ncbi:unnamed protein product [Orchesella dallaii]|uniref:DRBM domain-containing protein n=1 Tax=Orchesella dallaii TaxID=48710 RepID=A0ABP1PZK0_9HEXA